MTSSTVATHCVSAVVALAYTVALIGPAIAFADAKGEVVKLTWPGPSFDSVSSSAHGAISLTTCDGMETPPIAHWSMGRPQGLPDGSQAMDVVPAPDRFAESDLPAPK